MNRDLLWRSALVQTVTVVALALALAFTLPHSFFEDWGWLAGPAAWMVCAAITAYALHLPTLRVLAGAVLAGAVSALAVVVGVHWLGVVVAIGIFAVWCARIGPAGREPGWS